MLILHGKLSTISRRQKAWQKAFIQPSTINYQPSTINHQLSTINYQLSTINILQRQKKGYSTPPFFEVSIKISQQESSASHY
ncbi:MAG: hypothetical protein DSM107014_06620 [Gomphosphaeria aponina SAG 52.96 = DSM 107014]|uniref:Uncharacterized protein n=1 Tax=Gomphosphaeria aponina SAG 52.96 = DSM 107014 TaxID=1521640 RepID=A0A941GW87_9CHRO|nr:hypothetical protein [Gomphosphaeria aponina SAG 52.96 = DSM 107014]